MTLPNSTRSIFCFVPCEVKIPKGIIPLKELIMSQPNVDWNLVRVVEAMGRNYSTAHHTMSYKVCSIWVELLLLAVNMRKPTTKQSNMKSCSSN